MLRIGELARIAGVTPRLLRHYESVGVLAPALVDPRTGYRYYDRPQVAMLQEILAYRDAGVPLAMVAMLSTSPRALLERQRQALLAQRAVLDQRLAALNAMVSRPFRVKHTAPVWIASVRQSVETYDAADALMRELREALVAEVTMPSAAVWHCCRPDEGHIDCEMQVMFRRPGARLHEAPSQLVVSYVHTGPDAELPAIYREMTQWSHAARYWRCGPLREVYWNGVTEVQFPVRPS
jgi:DNA-binding transcriptional MerR regulator